MGTTIKKDKIKLALFIIFLLSILFIFTKSLNKEINIDNYLKSFSKQNEELKLKNFKQEKQLLLGQTSQFKDLYAKENLNLLKPWEKVLIIKENISKERNFLNKYLNVEDDKIINLDVKEQWIKYFNI